MKQNIRTQSKEKIPAEKNTSKNVVVIDNFDSFTFNLVDYFKQAGAELTVYRNAAAI